VELSEPVVADPLERDAGAGDAHQSDLGPEDHAREAQPADRRPEQVRMLRKGADDPVSIGSEELEPGDVGAEGAGTMMVLAVDVVGDGPADRHPSGPRHYREEPPKRNGQVEDFSQ
jgi:hypothetical protein